MVRTPNALKTLKITNVPPEDRALVAVDIREFQDKKNTNAKPYAFVLDYSGSMRGRQIEALLQGMRKVVSTRIPIGSPVVIVGFHETANVVYKSEKWSLEDRVACEQAMTATPYLGSYTDIMAGVFAATAAMAEMGHDHTAVSMLVLTDGKANAYSDSDFRNNHKVIAASICSACGAAHMCMFTQGSSAELSNLVVDLDNKNNTAHFVNTVDDMGPAIDKIFSTMELRPIAVTIGSTTLTVPASAETPCAYLLFPLASVGDNVVVKYGDEIVTTGRANEFLAPTDGDTTTQFNFAKIYEKIGEVVKLVKQAHLDGEATGGGEAAVEELIGKVKLIQVDKFEEEFVKVELDAAPVWRSVSKLLGTLHGLGKQSASPQISDDEYDESLPAPSAPSFYRSIGGSVDESSSPDSSPKYRSLGAASLPPPRPKRSRKQKASVEHTIAALPSL
jgi:hypothetical protein